jgi:hypothetical protein
MDITFKDPVSVLLDIGGKVIDRIWPDPAQAAAAKFELFKLQQSGDLEQMAGQMKPRVPACWLLDGVPSLAGSVVLLVRGTGWA